MNGYSRNNFKMMVGSPLVSPHFKFFICVGAELIDEAVVVSGEQ